MHLALELLVGGVLLPGMVPRGRIFTDLPVILGADVAGAGAGVVGPLLLVWPWGAPSALAWQSAASL